MQKYINKMTNDMHKETKFPSNEHHLQSFAESHGMRKDAAAARLAAELMHALDHVGPGRITKC